LAIVSAGALPRIPATQSAPASAQQISVTQPVASAGLDQAGLDHAGLDQAVLDHLGIAVRSVSQSMGLYEALGATVAGVEEVAQERVRVAMLAVGESRIELLEATEPDSVIGRFVDKRGEGLHHLALRVPNLEAAVDRMKKAGVRLVSEQIQIGAGGHRYVFIHPASANGVLLELVEAAASGERH
jgi:methylmalonyl-CoA epimerase